MISHPSTKAFWVHQNTTGPSHSVLPSPGKRPPTSWPVGLKHGSNLLPLLTSFFRNHLLHHNNSQQISNEVHYSIICAITGLKLPLVQLYFVFWKPGGRACVCLPLSFRVPGTGVILVFGVGQIQFTCFFIFFLSSFLLARRYIKICDDNVNIASILSQLKFSHFLHSLDSWAVISQSCENENISITEAKFPLQEGSTFNTFWL